MIIIGIAGGTGSGKTTIASEILEKIDTKNVVLLEQDSYYKDLRHLSFEERSKLNFDHPDAVDIQMMIKHIKQLKSGKNIRKPIYDFTKHIRTKESEIIKPQKILVVEGILILAITEIRNFLDMKVFIDTDDDERLLRRINRDMKERNRSYDNIQQQYRETVKPMHLEFVEPSKRYADIIIPRGGGNNVAIEMVATRLNSLINQEI